MSAGAANLSAPEAMVRVRMAMQQGNLPGARTIAEEARRAHPNDAALADAAGDLALKFGDTTAALAHFQAATKAAPAMLDYALNLAIALQRLERHREVITLLASHEKSGRSVPKYASIRALSHRSLGELSEAARWYDTVIALEPRHPRGLHGRARVAIERGEADALQRFDAALAVNPGDADLWLGKAQALDVAGDKTGARVVAEQICDQAPGFIAALSFLSGLRLAMGEQDFTAPFRNAAAKAPQDPNIAAAHAETFAGLDYAAEAAEVAAEARKRFPNEPHFALLEAVHTGSAGDFARAQKAFADVPAEQPGRHLHEARHNIRGGDIARADALLDRALAVDPWDISAWALRGIAWRLLEDERATWLHEQEGLVQFRPLVARDGLIDDCIAELRVLHASSAMPLGQSLRGGTQTRGILFHRTEPLLTELHQAILATLEEYRADLPSADSTHPLLRHRDSPWRLAGSWSVRLTGGGDHHTAHIHPQGILSSALYLIVPGEDGDIGTQGSLEVGRPANDLRLKLEPIHTIKPQRGCLALFPSSLYHGTTPFNSAERMTVAFDVIAATG